MNGNPTNRSSRVRRGRRVDSVLVLSFVIPALTVAALATVHPAPTEEGSRAPSTVPISRAVLVCPEAAGDVNGVRIALADPAVSGSVRVGGDDLALRAGALGSVRNDSSVVVRGEGSMASDLLAARDGFAGGTPCSAPDSDVRFTGVGAGPEHSSVLTLVNPDAGPALADITVHAAGGVQEVANLRGVAVPGHGTMQFDLAKVVPRREDLSLRIQVTRGRLSSSVLDRVERLGGAARAEAWLPPSAAPDTDALLLGVARGRGDRRLVLTNEGEDETQAEVRLVTPESEFSPAGFAPVAVPPGATVTVNLGGLLGSDVAADMVGLRIASTAPVTSMLRTRAGSRLTHVVPAPSLDADGATLLQAGSKHLVLAGADKVGEVTVLQRDAQGKALKPITLTARPDQALRITLADQARWIQVQVGEVSVHAAVEWGADSQHVRPLTELVTDTLVPRVRPALY